jgi:hypothetical protein
VIEPFLNGFAWRTPTIWLLAFQEQMQIAQTHADQIAEPHDLRLFDHVAFGNFLPGFVVYD